MNVQPYLFFDGRCEEALDFYKQALNAEILMLVRNKESPEKPPEGRLAPNSDEKIMHVTFKVGDSLLGASDGGNFGHAVFKGFNLTLQVADEAEAERCFNALAQGGTVHMPLVKTFFSPRFGMVADKFGVSWMIMVPRDRKP
jgi:PhnB protein